MVSKNKIFHIIKNKVKVNILNSPDLSPYLILVLGIYCSKPYLS